MDWLPLDGTALPIAALAYATNGWRVFPCTTGKQPRTPHGFTDASADPEQIRWWWRRWPEASIGWPIAPGLVVIDVDPRHGGADSYRALGPWPKTLTARTGGGGGHLVYSLPDGVEARQLAGFRLGLDTRAAGRGYVILAPSPHPSGSCYTWRSRVAPAPAPNWLLDIVRVRPAPAPAPYVPPIAGPALTRRQRYAAKVLAGEARAVAECAEGSRNHRLFAAWKRCAEFKDVIPRADAERELMAAALAAGLPEPEARKVLR